MADLPTPANRTEEYLNAIVLNTAGGGGTSNFDELSHRPKYNGSEMTGETNIPEVVTYTAGTGLSKDGAEFSVDTETIATKSDLADKQDTLTAGDNITISNNTISATDTTYTAGTNVSISSENVISATDTTYSAFTGTDGSSAGATGLVPAPATTDAGKFLSASGLWAAINTGEATQLTSADYDYPEDNPRRVALWKLPTGDYYADFSVIMFASTTTRVFIPANTQGLIRVIRTGDYADIIFTGRAGTESPYQEAKLSWVKANATTGAVVSAIEYLDTGAIENTLTSSETAHVLAASQGKILNDKIEGRIINGGTTAPTTSTVGAVGTLYSYVDTTGTTPVPHMLTCTAVSSTNPKTYTWTDLLGTVAAQLNVINNGSSN